MKYALVAFTVLALAVMTAAPALACPYFSNADIKVSNSNTAMVHNEVYVGANTGGNLSAGAVSAGGSNDATAWKGGDVHTGAAGNAGSATGNGGTIVTGNANASATVGNIVNTNKTSIKASCGYCYSNIDDSTVRNRNLAFVGNDVTVGADTGYNSSLGAESLGGDNNATAWKGGSTYTGAAGYGTTAVGNGGYINTGNANDSATVFDLVNTNVTRIRR